MRDKVASRRSSLPHFSQLENVVEGLDLIDARSLGLTETDFLGGPLGNLGPNGHFFELRHGERGELLNHV